MLVGGVILIGSLLIAALSAASPLLAVGAAGAAAVLYVVLFRADLMLLVLLAVMPWEGLLTFPSEAFSVVKILGFLLVVSYLLRIVIGETSVRWNGQCTAIAILLAIVVLSFAVSPDPAISALKMLRYLLFASLTFLMLQLLEGRETIIRAIKVYVASVAVAAAYGCLLFVTGEVERAAGPIPEPNDFGLVIATTIPLAIFVLADARRARKALWAVCGAALFIGLLATLSRGGIAGISAALAFAAITGRVKVRSILALGSIAFAIVMIALANASPAVQQNLEYKGNAASANVDSREAYWRAAVYMAADHPLVGVGPGLFPIIGPRDYIRNSRLTLRAPIVHNSYLEVAAEAGVLALLAFLALLAVSWAGLARTRRAMTASGDVQGRRLVDALQCGIVASLVAGMFLSAQVIVPFWLLAGLAGGLARVAAPREVSAVPGTSSTGPRLRPVVA